MARIVHLSTVHRTRDNRIHNKECKALLAAGHDLTLVVRADEDETTPVPIAALPTPSGRLERVLGLQRTAWGRVSALKPEILHIHDPELIPFALAYRARHRATKIVYDAHEDLVGQISTKPYLAGWRRPVARLAAAALIGLADRGFDAVVAATEPVRARFPHAQRRSVVVRNYPWLSDYSADPHPVPGRVVYVGDLTEERKLTFMLDVIERVRADVPEAHLVLAGRPGRECEDTLKARADGVAVTHLGLLPPDEVPGVTASAQVGLVFLQPLPNYLTSLPTKLFEYMASSVPYLASDFPHWRASFEAHHAGRFADTEDLGATAQALVEMLRDPAGCREMGANGRAVIERELNFEAEARTLVDVVARLAP